MGEEVNKLAGVVVCSEFVLNFILEVISADDAVYPGPIGISHKTADIYKEFQKRKDYKASMATG